jgi:glycosyltransferase involved in cell wall biosynthesis
MTTSTPLISVVIPCYNQARFLGEAVESVLAQTHPRTEVVLIDDGSTDDPSAAAHRYPGVLFRRQENQGPAAARNAGLRVSTGRYLTFLDADDRLLPAALETGLRYLAERRECAFVSGHCRYITADGSPMPTPPQPLVESEHYAALLYRNYVWAGSTVLHRRECLEAVGGYNPSLSVKGAEDYDLYLRIARRFPIFCHGEVVSEYRQYDAYGTNVSGDPGMVMRAALTTLRAQREYVSGNERYEAAYQRGIKHKKEFWGGLLFDQMAQQFATRRERPRAVGGLLTLLRYDAGGLLRRGLRRVWHAGSD